jgi:hypothetical protein
MTEYVKFKKHVIVTMDGEGLFKYLWEKMPLTMEKHGADTDYENDFGEITHSFANGKLLKL